MSRAFRNFDQFLLSSAGIAISRGRGPAFLPLSDSYTRLISKHAHLSDPASLCKRPVIRRSTQALSDCWAAVRSAVRIPGRPLGRRAIIENGNWAGSASWPLCDKLTSRVRASLQPQLCVATAGRRDGELTKNRPTHRVV